MKHTSIKLRVYPTKEQLRTLPQWFGSCRFVFNHALAIRKEDYERWVALGKPKKHDWANFYTLNKELQVWREEFLWLKQVPSQTLQQTLRHLDTAFNNWFKHGASYPRFKQRSFAGSAHLTNQQIREHHLAIWNNKLEITLPKKLGVLKAKLHRPLPSGRLLKTVISRNACKQYFVSLMYEVPNGYNLRQSKFNSISRCGIDLGVVQPLTVVYKKDGVTKSKVLGKDVKTRLERLEIKRKRYQRSYNRKLESAKMRQSKVKPKSETGEVELVSTKNLEKARLKVAKVWQKEKNVRKDFSEKTSNTLASKFEVIKFEDLKLSNMTKQVKDTEDGTNRKSVSAKSGLNREMLRLGLANVVSLTKYKASLYGNQVQFVNPQHTSQRCSCCGYIDKANRKTQSKFECLECGFSMNADTNAGLNIMTRKPLDKSQLQVV